MELLYETPATKGDIISALVEDIEKFCETMICEKDKYVLCDQLINYEQ